MRVGQVYRKTPDDTVHVVIGSFGNHVTLIDQSEIPYNYNVEKDFEELCRYVQCSVEDYPDWVLSFIEKNTHRIINPPAEPSTWQHIYSGAIYVVVRTTNSDSSIARRGEFEQTVVYEDLKTGKSWSRPLVDFLSNTTPYNP